MRIWYLLTMARHSIPKVVVPLHGRVRPTRNRGAGMLLFAAAATLLGLSFLAAISPKLMLLGAGVTFVVLLGRFVWLVGREMQ